MAAEDYEEDEKVRVRPKKRPAAAAAVETSSGQVIAIGARGVQVMVGDAPVRCRPQAGLAVGDRVEIDALGAIRTVLPRRTTLSRPDPSNAQIERVIAANIEVVVMVTSVRSPELRPGLIDRYLIAIQDSGAEPILCVNKIDLMESPDELRPLEPYRALGIRIFPVCTRTGEGVEDFRAALAGKLAVFVGHSGVGKSSLMNALHPAAAAITGRVSFVFNKGTHTTTGSTMYRMDAGIRIIDTPGIREFGLWKLDLADLMGYFHEFDEYREKCQFADCTHTHEPVCGVIQAVDAGLIPRVRYDSYVRIREST